MPEVTVPDLIHSITDELCCGTFSGLVRRKVAEQDGMFRFSACPDDCGFGIIDDGICRRAWRWWEWCTPSSHVQCSGLNEPNEVVHAILVVGNVEEEGIEDIAEGSESSLGWPKMG